MRKMKTQSQWLFEAPPALSGDSYLNPEWEWEFPEDSYSLSPLTEVDQDWETTESVFTNKDVLAQQLASIAKGINPNALPHIRLILQECDRQGVTDKSHIAYILATAHHESWMGKLMVEKASGRAYEGRKGLDNIYPGDGPKYKGRGFVQITGRKNYKKYTAILKQTGINVDLLNNPERATEPAIAAIILVHGMKYGGFTGKRLSDFGTDGNYDFFQARKIVNPGAIYKKPEAVEKLAATARKYRAVMDSKGKLDTPSSPSSSSDIDRAVGLNYKYSQSLGWQSQVDKIVRLLGFTAYTPNEQIFAEAVARWQESQGLLGDGVIGPKTWVRMQLAMGLKPVQEPDRKPQTPQPNISPSSCLTTFPIPTALSTPSRDLTRKEARDIVVYLIQQGVFTLKQAWSPLKFDKYCQVIQPRPASRITIEPPIIDGVRFVAPSTRYRIDNLDVRMVVFLFRLARMLRTKWGVTEIKHQGIGAGRGASYGAHNTGRALDLVGVSGILNNSSANPQINGPYELSVLKDWGQKPVFLPNGKQAQNWPDTFKETYYRLDPNQNPYVDLSNRHNFLAYAIFRDIYDLAARECTDTNPARYGNTALPTTIGKASRFILHPDHPNPNLRKNHKNHFHIQIGPTGEEKNPP